MKLHEIRELMEAFDGMNICRLELEDGPFAITLSKEHGVRDEESPQTPPGAGGIAFGGAFVCAGACGAPAG